MVRASVEQRELDVDVDLEENVSTATVTEEIAIEDLDDTLDALRSAILDEDEETASTLL